MAKLPVTSVSMARKRAILIFVLCCCWVCQLNLASAALASGKKRHRENDNRLFGETNFAYHWREKDKQSR